jgi:hypothetical protein
MTEWLAPMLLKADDRQTAEVKSTTAVARSSIASGTPSAAAFDHPRSEEASQRRKEMGHGGFCAVTAMLRA